MIIILLFSTALFPKLRWAQCALQCKRTTTTKRTNTYQMQHISHAIHEIQTNNILQKQGKLFVLLKRGQNTLASIPMHIDILPKLHAHLLSIKCFFCLSLSVCFVSLSLCLSGVLSACLCLSLSSLPISLSIKYFVCLSLSVSVKCFVCLFLCLSSVLSACLFVYQVFCLPIFLSIKCFVPLFLCQVFCLHNSLSNLVSAYLFIHQVFFVRICCRIGLCLICLCDVCETYFRT